MTSPNPHVAPDILLSGLWIYPLKSAAGLTLATATLTDRGLALDRRWMLIDMHGEALTQRECPALRLVVLTLQPSGWAVSAPGMPELRLESELQGPHLQATMWKQPIQVTAAPRAASAWFSAYLQRPCTLVYQPDASHRYRGEPAQGTLLNLSDGHPVHLISEASLADLNTRLPQPVGAWRFRPNLVVQGSAAYEEDDWRWIRIGSTDFRVVESCARCSVVNVDEWGKGGGTVLRTLASYRRRGKTIPFGQHLEHQQLGDLKVGDRVQVLEKGGPPP